MKWCIISDDEVKKSCLDCLELVFVLVERRDVLLATLTLTDVLDELTGLRIRVERIAVKHIPVIKHALRERLARGRRAKSTRETEGFHDRQVRLDVVNRGTRTLDFDQVHRLEETRFRGEGGRVQDATARRDDL